MFKYIDDEVTKNVVNETKHLAFKEDLMLTKEDLIKEISIVRSEIGNVRSELNKTIYMVGLIQFLAIVGSVIGIVSFMLK